MSTPAEIIEALLSLSRDLGAEHRGLAILGEGNISAKLSHDTFLVKASGSNLATLDKGGVVECRFEPLLRMLDHDDFSEGRIEEHLMRSRVDSHAKKPSVESLLHAHLLTLPEIEFVGHAHPVSVGQILCSPLAAQFAGSRLFPDEVVCCGPVSLLIPYVDPGLKLAQALRDSIREYMEKHTAPPRVILLENHGLIALGRTPEAVKAAMLMADKAARIFIGAAALGGPRSLPAAQVTHIAGRIDEHYRRRELKL